jgi:GLPGLI family protein
MKKTLSFLLLCFFAGIIAAQTSGTVSYTEKIRLDIKLDGPAAAMMDSLPKEQSVAMLLYFNEEESLYLPDKSKNKTSDIDKEDQGSHLIIKMDHPESRTYRDIKNKTLLQQREFMGRKFLITADDLKSEWKLSGKQKTILGYTCQEATKQDKDRKIIAWFAPSIAVPAGPASAGDLPGLILEEDIGDGKVVITATNILLKPVDKSLLEKPKEGKKMTKEEFDKMVEQKTKEMNLEGGGQNGQIIIRTK